MDTVILRKAKSNRDTENYDDPDERQDIQKKTFTKWINSQLTKTKTPLVKDLFQDLRDGHRLLVLLGTLTNSQLKPEKGRMRVHHINNLNKCLQVIQEHGIRLVNISSDDICEGNPKLTLGLIWLIALAFNGQNLVSSQASNGVEKSLLSWVNQFTEPNGLKINDFSSSWSDGRAFLYILNSSIPAQVDLQASLKRHPNARLKLAFDLAHKYLNIEKLLDPEDVNTSKPDKKSILMYVMCLYHSIGNVKKPDEYGGKIIHPGDASDLEEISLGSSNVIVTTVSGDSPLSLTRSSTFTIAKGDNTLQLMDVSIDDPKIPDLLGVNDNTKRISRPLSTATNASIEINNYQTALEAVLALLLEDEETLSKDIPDPINFATAKEQFHDNEDFMLKLTEHQQFVGEALEEGSSLISESQRTSGLSAEDQNEIRQQMVLLNERWETLRLRALDVQSKILARLAEFQTEQIEKLRLFLSNAEDRISRMSDIGPTLNDLDKQQKDLDQLRNDLKEQQGLVDSLSNMVVIINDESGNFSDLEDKLSALGERWAHVIKWNETRAEKLHQYKIITKWLDAREHDLKTMETVELQELGTITRRMNDLRYCQSDLEEVERYLQDLRQMVETSMQEGQQTQNVLQQLEGLEDRLDALKHLVEVQIVRIEEMGFKFPQKTEERRIERPGSWIDYQMIIKFGESSDDTELSPQSNKKRKLHKTEKMYLLEGKILESFNYLENLEVRLNNIKHHSLRNQNEALENVERDIKERDSLVRDLKELLTHCVVEADMSGHNLSLEESQVKQIADRYDSVLRKLDHQRIDTQHMISRDKFYKSLTGFKLVLADSRDWYQQHANTATKHELETRLSDMNSLSKEISEAKAATANLTDDLKEWKDDFNIFYDSWMDMKKAISRLIQEKGGSEETNEKLFLLQEFVAEIDDLKVYVSDLSKMNSNLDKLNKFKVRRLNLQPEFEYILDQIDPNSIKDFIDVWAKLPDCINELNKTESWLNDLEKNTPKNKNEEILNSNELFQIKSKFQGLKEMCEKETINFCELNEIGSDLLLQIDELIPKSKDQKYTYLARKFTRLNARWNDVTALVYNRTAVLEHMSNQLGEFKKLIASETGYLDKLEKKLRESPENAADAEEIIEELDDLENNIRNHSDERLEKIQEIGAELSELQFMKDTIEEEVNNLVDRWNQLEHKAKKRTEILELEVTEAERSEECVSKLEKWLSRVDEILSEHLENDVTIEDLPHDFQRLAEEFRDCEKTLHEVRELIQHYMKKGKTEAANRLREQYALLESRFKNCQMKMNKCTAPQAAYESRLSRALAELRNVERTTLVLDVASAGPSSVHDQYSHCLKTYRTLSEIKSDIETTIKTGRKVCEDKFTKDPKHLSQRIDALKHLYNALGENVTQSKVALEGMIKLAKQLQNQFELTEQSLRALEIQSDKADKNAKFQEIEESLGKCDDIYDKYSETCEPVYMEDVRQRIDMLKKKYFKLSSADVIKRLNEMKSTLQNLDNISLETLRTMESDLQQINVSDPAIEELHTQVIGIVKDTINTRTAPQTPTTITDPQDPDTEIVIVSDTVRQRRARTPSSSTVDSNSNKTPDRLSASSTTNYNENNEIPAKESDSTQISNAESNADCDKNIDSDSDQNGNVMPDLLPKTFHLAESSALFSQISSGQNIQEMQQNKFDPKEIENSVQQRQQQQQQQNVAIVEVVEKDLQHHKMSVLANVVQIDSSTLENDENSDNDAKDNDNSKKQETVLLETVNTLEVEFVETVDLSDGNSDTDSSIKLEGGAASRSKTSLENSLIEYDSEKELEEAFNNNNNDIEMREGNNQDGILKIERQRISYDEKEHQSTDNERDILRDSEDDEFVLVMEVSNELVAAPISAEHDSIETSFTPVHRSPKTPKKPKRLKLCNNSINNINNNKNNSSSKKNNEKGNNERDSFYNSEENLDEPLVFSDDEDIPRFSFEMPTGSDSDMSRIETPKSKSSNIKFTTAPQSPSLNTNIGVNRGNNNNSSSSSRNNDNHDNSNITLTWPRYELYRSSTSLEQRVQEFDKTAKYMIRKLEATKEKIDASNDNESVIENLKLLIAPDAATLISQGDTLVLETHGKPGGLSQIVLKAQTILREKFREVQQSKTPKLSTSAEAIKDISEDRNDLQSSPIGIKVSNEEINIDELVAKGCKRIYDLIDKPLDRKSESDLKRRIFEINDRRDDLKLAFNAVGKSKNSTTKNKKAYDALEKAKRDLAIHSDSVETSLANLQYEHEIEEDQRFEKQLTEGELILNAMNISSKPSSSSLKEMDHVTSARRSPKPKESSSSYVPGSFSAKQQPSKSIKLSPSNLTATFDKSVLQISDWLTLERNMIKSQSIPVGDIDAIRIAIEKQKNVLRELEVKKPQLNELVHTAETLKTDVNRQQLQEKDSLNESESFPSKLFNFKSQPTFLKTTLFGKC
ncbi:dystrophin, isoforms A/C/F/G/H-like [Condylostylus longicornis]|uniref:dystrophin, isoforms A/C/F/G/H-like n=1 Tax=Condylostylus longicornis TaxID=2530218 RepID=UPI00244E0BB8|nr:dystrophin, isoforms A/C/F/G/H-like [Condylostylus longicornis]